MSGRQNNDIFLEDKRVIVLHMLQGNTLKAYLIYFENNVKTGDKKKNKKKREREREKEVEAFLQLL